MKDLGNLLKTENENLKTKVTENSEKIKNIWESGCPLEKSEYFEVLGKCYYSDNITRNFDDSQVHCKEIFPLNGRLFEPRAQNTNKEVVKAFIKHQGDTLSPWIGITDRSSQGSYRYDSDNGYLTASQWDSNGNQPNDDTHHCVRMCNSSGDWCDVSCSSSRRHVCERTY